MKFHHIGIIVKNIDKALLNLNTILDIKKKSKIFLDRKWKVKVIFLHDSRNKIIFEIIEPLNSKSPISTSLKKNINILNHVAFQSKNFNQDKKKIFLAGGIPVTEALEAIAFKNKKIQFFLTKENFLIELIEK